MRPVGWRRKALLVVLSPPAFLVLLEGLLVLAGVDPKRYRYIPGGRYFVPCQESGSPAGYRRWDGRRLSRDLTAFRREKPAGGFRLFVVGESTVQGFPYPLGSFCDWLSLRLGAMLDGRAVEVVNAGTGGWYATELRKLVRECLRHHPDAVVWMAGHNELLPGSLDAMRHERDHPALAALERTLLGLRTAQGMRALLPRPRFVLGPARGEREPPHAAEREATRRRFRETVAGAVSDAREAGVPILLCTSPRNAREAGPFESSFSERLQADAALRALWERTYAEGLALLEDGKPAAALERFGEASELDDLPARLHFASARAHERLGAAGPARAAFQRAVDLDVWPWRAPSWIQEAVRGVAREASVPLVDLERIFDDASPAGIAGGELICDIHHPSLEGHERIAEVFLDVLQRELGLALDRSRDVDPSLGRTALGLDAYRGARSRRAEFLATTRFVVLAGVVDDRWRRTMAAASELLRENPSDWEIRGAEGILLAISGDRVQARTLIEHAMSSATDVRLTYLFYYWSEPQFRRAIDAAGIDMAAVGRALSAEERSLIDSSYAQVLR